MRLGSMCMLPSGRGSVGASWFNVFFTSSISLLIFYLLVLSIIEGGVLKCPALTVELFLPSILPVFAAYILMACD